MNLQFGWLERVLAFVILVTMWSLFSTATVLMVREHGTQVEEFTQAMSLGSLIIVTAIIMFSFGRPMMDGVSLVYKKGKKVIA